MLYFMVVMQEDEIEENFLKGLAVTIGFLALFSLFILIPFLGPFIAATYGAYFAGYRGARYSVDWRKLGLSASVIWATVLIIVAIIIIDNIPLRFISEIHLGAAEIAIICIIYILFIVFCALGARARFQERAEYV